MRSISRPGRLVAVFLLVLTMLALPVPVSAARFFSDTESVLPPGQTIDDDVYIFSGTVSIDGRITRSLVVAGGTVTLNGRVDGDVIAAGGTVSLNGPVGGTLRVGAGTVTVNGPVGWDALIGGGEVTTGPGGRIARDLLLAAGAATIAGQIGGNVRGSATRVELLGEVRGDVMLDVEEGLSLGPQAVVGGDLLYSAPQQASIAPGARVQGETRFTPRTPQAGREPTLPERAMAWFNTFVLRLAWALVAGSLLILLLPRRTAAVADTLRATPLPSLLWGLALLVGVPVLIVIGLLTVVGIPAALLLLGIYLAVLYLSQVLLGVSLVRGMVPRSWRSDRRLILWVTMLVGTSLVVFVRLLPLPLGIASWWTAVVSLLIGALALGALWTDVTGWGKPQSALVPAVGTPHPPAEPGPPLSPVPEPTPATASAGPAAPDSGELRPITEPVIRAHPAGGETAAHAGDTGVGPVAGERTVENSGTVKPSDESRASGPDDDATPGHEDGQHSESERR